MSKRIGFIGLGRMGKAICRGALAASTLDAEDVSFTVRDYDRATATASELGISYKSLLDLVTDSDILILAVKPQQLTDISDVLAQSKASLVISVLAGVRIETLSQIFGADTQIIRSMPNTPLVLGHGATALAFSDGCSEDDKTFATELFGSMGKVYHVTESAMDAVTGVSGSGPAFMYKIIDVIAQVASEEGLETDVALSLAAQSMIGAGHMVLEAGQTTHELIDDVKSPGGTTEAGLNAFDESGVRAMVSAAISRSRELGVE